MAKIKARKSFTVNDFKGVDYLNPSTKISDSRASDMSNIVIRDGIGQKRYGYEPCVYAGKKINGVFFTANYIVVVTTSKLYLVHGVDINYNNYLSILDVTNVLPKYTYTFARQTSINNTHFIKYGDLVYVIAKFNSCVVVDTNEDAETVFYELKDKVYTPTMIIGLRNEDSDIHSAISYEDCNILSDYRIVTFRTHTLPQATYDAIAGGTATAPTEYKYQLVGKLIINQTNHKVSPFLNSNTASYSDGILELIINEATYSSTKVLINGNAYLGFVNSSNETIGYMKNYEVDDDDDIKVEKENVELVLLIDPEPIKLGDNASIKYINCSSTNKSIINTCNTSITMSVNGNDVIFISSGGCIDYHSQEPAYASTTNFGLYISDLDYCKYGTDNNTIMAYNILNDGTLCVLTKNSGDEPTIYFRTPTLANAIAYDGSTIYGIDGTTPLQEYVFPMKAGNIGEQIGFTNCFKQFGGDPVFLSTNGLYGITLQSNTQSNIRYARERSRLINRKLMENYSSKNYSMAILGKKLYISDGTGKIYVADTSYKYQLEDDNDTFQYEWWVIDLGINVNYIYSYDNILMVIDDEGYIYKFDKDVYVDKKITAYNLALGLEVGSKELTINNDYAEALRTSSKAVISYAVYFNLPITTTSTIAHNYATEGNYITFTYCGDDSATDQAKRIFYYNTLIQEKDGVYIKDIVVEEGYEVDINEFLTYYLSTKNENNEQCDMFKFCLRNTAGEIVSLEHINSFTICIKSNYYSFTNIIEDGVPTNKFNVTYRNVGLKVNSYEGTPTVYFVKEETVKCYYLTKPFNFGTTMYTKTIYNMSLVNDMNNNANVNLGVRLKGIGNTVVTTNIDTYTSVNNCFDFRDFSFSDIQMNAENYAKSYNVFSKLRKVNFLQLLFSNDNNTNCIISSLSMLYTIGGIERGEN